MLITCDCLNITVCSSATEFLPSESSNECLPNYIFFKEDVALLKLCSITVQVPNLIKEDQIEDWKIVACINCGKECFSSSKNFAPQSLLVNKNLKKETSQVNDLKQTDIYSPIFKILIYDNNITLDTDLDFKISLYPVALTWLSEKASITEERIKIFSEKEYIALDDLRKRAYKDQMAIIRKEKESLLEKNIKDPVDNTSDSMNVASISKTFQKPSKILPFKNSSLDAEGVFLFEEFDNADSDGEKVIYSSSEDSDDEDNYMSRKIGISHLAKSLPIPVPQFMEDRRHNDLSSGSPQVPSDIAASIQALAKSVHGDTIFGELPRPRFSTHL